MDFISLWYRKEKGEGGIFNFVLRVSVTVCSGPVGLLCQILGGWVSLGGIF
jgi:hypothetical protein